MRDPAVAGLIRSLVGGGLPVAAADVRDFFAALASGPTSATTTTIDRALLGGALADRIGFAFAAGYAAALQACFGEAVGVASLAATESGGAHPRAIQTSIVPEGDGFVLDGEKQWTTLAHETMRAVVFARVGERDGRPELRAAVVPLDREGVTVEGTMEVPFCPEVTHAKLRFAGVRVAADELLPGDAYVEYLKPFRTIEDLHVLAALDGHLAATFSRFGHEPSACARVIAAVVGLRAIGAMDVRAPEMHVALAGAFEETAALQRDAAPFFERLPEDVRARWVRDQPLLSVAGRARTERFARAWKTVRP